MGFETDIEPPQLKIGDGVTPWNSLDYFTGMATPSSIAISAGTQNFTGSDFVFANANGISFEMNNGTISGSYNSNQFLGTGATASFRFTSQNSQLQFTSANSNFRFTSQNSQLRFTSQDSQLQFTSQMSDYLGTGATASFQFTSQMSDYVNTSVSSQFLTTQTVQPVAASAGNGSFAFSTLKFVDSNGVSFSSGTDGIRATVKTDYQSSGPYLTTAMLSNAATISNINVSGGTTSSNLSNFKLIDTNGISWSLDTGSKIYATIKTDYQSSGNYLTTAAQSSQTLAFSLGGNSATTNSSVAANGGFILAGGNGVTIQQSNNTLSVSVATNYQSQGAYLTTAMQSNAATISNINISGGTTSSNLSNFKLIDSNGVSWSLDTGSKIYATVKTDYQSSGAYLTTAMQSNAATISNINISGGTTSSNLSNLKFIDSNGVSWSLDTGSKIYATVKTDYQTAGAYLTTAAQSTQTFLASLSGNTATTNSSQIGNGAFAFAGGNGVTLQQSNNTISWSVATNYQSQGAYLTTAALSSQTLAISLSGNTATTNSSQILNGGYALAGGNGVTLQQSNNTISVSVATNYQSQGAYLTTADLSQNSSKYVQNWKLTGNTAGTTSSAQGTDIWFAGGNGVTISGSSNSLSFSVATNYQSQAAYLTTADLSANSSKYIQNWKLTGNTAGTTSSAQGTDMWLAGGNGVTISGSSNSLSFSVATNYQSQGAYLTTAMQSNAATISNINISGGSTSSNLSNFKLIDTNGVSWSVDTGSKVYATVKTDYQTSGAYLTTAMLSNAVTISNINVSAGAASNNLSALVFSNSNGMNFGLNGSTITAQDAYNSYFNFPQVLNGVVNQAIQASNTSYLNPFILPYNLSASYIRLQMSFAPQSTTFATTANTTFSGSILQTINVVIYSLGVGASSRSLQYVASGSAGISQQISLQANSNGSQYTVTQNVTYPFEGATTNNLQTNFALSNLSFQLSTGSWSNFNGIRFLDIPFANSLSFGMYWVAVGMSSTTSTQGTNALTQNRIIFSHQVVTQPNNTVNMLGVATNSSAMPQYGVGSWSTNAAGTTASIGLANISSSASFPLMIFQLIRQV